MLLAIYVTASWAGWYVFYRYGYLFRIEPSSMLTGRSILQQEYYSSQPRDNLDVHGVTRLVLHVHHATDKSSADLLGSCSRISVYVTRILLRRIVPLNEGEHLRISSIERGQQELMSRIIYSHAGVSIDLFLSLPCRACFHSGCQAIDGWGERNSDCRKRAALPGCSRRSLGVEQPTPDALVAVADLP